ncbi:hypothetical protein [Hydrogenophaga defluvii]|uniref:Uncharacterized protein n=1 Tax=Hydrogenophaga defluvii TaxID=249410 RepID=A0ABW2SGK6_9BURK
MPNSDRPALVTARAARALHRHTLLQAQRMNVVCILGGAIAGLLILGIVRPELLAFTDGINEIHMIIVVAAILCVGVWMTPFRDPRFLSEEKLQGGLADCMLVLSVDELEAMANMGLTHEDLKNTLRFATYKTPDTPNHNVES